MLDAELSQRLTIEMQLRTVLLRLHSARLEAKVVRALESGNAALRDILAKDLNEDRVNDVMAEVDDAIARQEEVSRALGTGTSPSWPLDANQRRRLTASGLEPRGLRGALQSCNRCHRRTRRL